MTHHLRLAGKFNTVSLGNGQSLMVYAPAAPGGRRITMTSKLEADLLAAGYTPEPVHCDGVADLDGLARAGG